VRRRTRGIIAAAATGATALAGVMIIPPAAAAPPGESPDAGGSSVQRADNRPGPLTARQNERRKAAQKLILSGKASPDEGGAVALNAEGDKYYQAAVTGTGRLFTILAEFGDQGSGKLGTVPGPLHNAIPEPDRAVNNSTHWREDFNTAYYHDLFFGDGDPGTTEQSFADFYSKQSSGAYTVDGEVSDWVKVPGNASTYGDNSVEDYGGAWKFIADSANAWYAAQVAAGRSADEIKAELATFDVWDRYDHDNDGDFDEPDGYIDHFQAVHAGEGEDAGGGLQGEDAIWSHRWYVNSTDYGVTGPTDARFGGTQIGDTGMWIGDYTVEAENGGLGVFAHEYAHDLGLPDFYDTAGGENSTGFWTLMSSGSWLGDGTEDIGTTPNHMGPWEKLQLGWLDYSVVNPGESGDYTLSPAALQTDGQEQAVVVDVPDATTTTTIVQPAGGHAWWTSSADDLNTTLTRSVDVSAVRSATVTAKAWYDIEAGYDYLYAEYSTDGGENWTQAGKPLDGSSSGRWTNLRYSVPGGSADTLFRFRYQSDGGVHLAGAFLDDITIKSGGTTLLPTDNVEGGANGWTAAGGFTLSDGTSTSSGDRYYLAENRTYSGYDATLETGPYQFSEGITRPDWVEHFPYQDGMVVWAIDESYSDNNTIEHLGHGLALPVDAGVTPIVYPDGTMPSNRRQPFDAAFGLNPLDEVSLHKQVLVGKGKKATVETLAASSTPGTQKAMFDDTNPDAFYSADNPLGGVKVAGHGVNITVTSQNTGGTMTISVVNPAE